jgi:serine/threonine protein kinase
LIGQTLAHYRITAAIGAGGMGEVYRATDTKLGRDVALKLLPEAFADDPDRLARFEREAKVLASLNHPGIAHLYGFESTRLEGGATVHFLAMELVEGEDLAERLKRGAIAVDEAIAIAKQVAEALEEAHEKGIVHRDLKPANVKVTPDGKVKVLDFGLAKAWTGEGGGAGSSADLSQSPTLAQTGTAAGIILGTAAYMSPEQARGKAVDKRADIWAFGVVLWEMLTGRRLFVGETVSDVLAAVLTREPEWAVLPPTARGRVRDLLRRCLERNARQRLHDIADARILLDEAISGAADDSPAIAAGVGVASRRQRLLVASLAAMALAVAGLVWAILRRPTIEPPRPRSLSVVLPESLWLLEDRDGSVAISPDGARMVVTAEDEGARRLYLRELDSPDLRPLPGTEGAIAPFFSPDGRWIAFSKDGLHKVSLDGGAPVKIAPAVFGSGAWSPEGEIYFTPSYNTGLFKVAAAGGTPQQLTRADPAQGELNHSYPELLPGGRALLFTSHRATMAESRVEALSLASGERHVVVENAIEARYLRGGYLAFVRDETLTVAPFDAQALRLTGPALPARHQVAVGYGNCHAEYALSGNGTLAHIPRSVMPARREVVRLDRAGRAETILAAEKTYGGPALSPDGRQLALTRNEGGLDLLLYDLEHKATARLAASPRREFGAAGSCRSPGLGTSGCSAGWRVAKTSGASRPTGGSSPSSPTPPGATRSTSGRRTGARAACRCRGVAGTSRAGRGTGSCSSGRATGSTWSRCAPRPSSRSANRARCSARRAGPATPSSRATTTCRRTGSPSTSRGSPTSCGRARSGSCSTGHPRSRRSSRVRAATDRRAPRHKCPQPAVETVATRYSKMSPTGKLQPGRAGRASARAPRP